MDNTKLSFAIDASQIEIKPLLQKEFLELSMRAISSANPNRNNSWFTRESMEKGIETFKDKPILGYFENGDFVSHNGQWQQDPETDMAYWDTLGKQGERILGVIRQSDEVKIIEDENGLSWICLTCALWVQYGYKQVKKLLKDAKRAKENGGPTKNISVEVDITDYEMLPNGVMKINDFNLVGITILGSRNGIKVEPGIEDAELSVIDIMGKEFFDEQQKSLRLAYEKLDNSIQDTQKEVFSQVETENMTQEEVVVEETPVVTEEPTVTEEPVATFEGNVEETVTEPVVEETNQVEEGQPEQEPVVEQEVTIEPVQEEFATTEPEEPVSEEPVSEEPITQEPVRENECEICDIAWLITNLADMACRYDQCFGYYNCDDYQGPNKDYICCVLERCSKQFKTGLTDLSQLLSTLAEEVSDDQVEQEKEMSCYDLKSLINDYKDLRSKYDQACEQLNSIAHQDFLKAASELINSVSALSEEKAKDFYAQCDNGTITSLDDLKIKIAVEVTFAEDAPVVEQHVETYSAPVTEPDTESVFNNTAITKKADKWTKLHEYIGK